MAVTEVGVFPLALKIVFPPLFLLEWLRRVIHRYVIIDMGPDFLEKCYSVLKPFFDEMKQYLEEKQKATGKQPVVLEYGPGPFPSWEAFPPGIHLIIVEPCPDFVQPLQEAWEKSELKSTGAKFTLITIPVEDLDEEKVPSDSVDLVLARLVNCSVGDLDGCFKQVRRMLKKGGRYYYFDHVKALSWPIVMVQYLLTLPVFSFFTDCTLVSEPYKVMKRAGFSDVKVNVFDAPLKGAMYVPYRTSACGYAEK